MVLMLASLLRVSRPRGVLVIDCGFCNWVVPTFMNYVTLDKFLTLLLKYGENKKYLDPAELLGLNELMYIKCLEQCLAGEGTQQRSVIATRDLVYCRCVLGVMNFQRMACRTDGRAGAFVSEMPTVFLQASVA